jgi:hypothetical protein
MHICVARRRCANTSAESYAGELKQLKLFYLLRDIGGKHAVPILGSARKRNPRHRH